MKNEAYDHKCVYQGTVITSYKDSIVAILHIQIKYYTILK